MCKDYFDWKGKRYYTGAVFKIRGEPNYIFIEHDLSENVYVFTTKGSMLYYKIKPNKLEWLLLWYVGQDNSVKSNTYKKKSDAHVDDTFIGWMWYITMMIVLAIFKHRILGWVALTIVFLVWRSSKIKEEGTYYEWKA